MQSRRSFLALLSGLGAALETVRPRNASGRG